MPFPFIIVPLLDFLLKLMMCPHLFRYKILKQIVCFIISICTVGFVFYEFVQDDPLLYDYNVEQRVNDFIEAAMAQVRVVF